MPVDLVITLDRTSSVTLAQQIATEIRGAVGDRRLAPGDRLPSSRALAAELGVARMVVQQAYDQVVAEGWAESRRGAGTYIGDVATLAPPPARPPVRAATTDDAELISLRPGVPWGERTASAAWRRAWRTVSATPIPAGYPDAQGLPGLRDQVCAYLGRARGIATTPDELVITSGSAHG
ncbi:MAG: GntR family transcriptional regulator, partial [Propionibacteriales bacterium]|nr:GntR family transcriptional regulator [Propionibacteriales bacterium]